MHRFKLFESGSAESFMNYMHPNQSWETFNMGQFIQNFITEIPKVMMESCGKLFSLFVGENLDATYSEFSEPVNIIYISLFALSSIPFLDLYVNFMIIIKALMDNKMSCSIVMTTYTTFISLFQYHFYDMGLIFKWFYGLDTYSHYNERITKENLGLLEPKDYSKNKNNFSNNYLLNHQNLFNNSFKTTTQDLSKLNLLNNLFDQNLGINTDQDGINQLKDILKMNNIPYDESISNIKDLSNQKIKNA